ncbi:MAG: hypothetical protein H6718_33740 [Polyangiaceae bacterium]|nr:hypothetical protein [Polyangiaceae bacterium]MCB9608415.1 hypothetical protein [Polyangiaceae bacterium]
MSDRASVRASVRTGAPRFTFLAGAIAGLSLLGVSNVAHAQFADPPGGQPVVAVGGDEYVPPPSFEEPFYHPHSTVRFGVGPVLRLSEPGADGGLGLTIDVGSDAAGVRFSGMWVKTGADTGLSQYAGELWLDFGHNKRLHPIIAAGAGLARLDLAQPDGSINGETIGVGLLRGSLQYLLPVDGTDARASLDVSGALPAIRGENGPDVKPWMTIGASVVVGF